MVKYALGFLLVVHCSFASNPFDPEQVKEDIEFLEQELTLYHPGLYRYNSKEVMASVFDEMSNTTEALNPYELYGRISYILSQVHCGHTRSRMSDEMRMTFENDQRVLPFTVRILNNELFIDQSLTSKLQAGQRISAIDGLSSQDIQDRIYSHLPADGYITTGKTRLTERLFSAYYSLYVRSNATDYEISLQLDERVLTTVTVDGVPVSEIDKINHVTPQQLLLSLQISPEYALMRIGTFGAQSLSVGGYNYEKFLQESFEELRSKNVQNLILDLRGNGGGRDNYGALLVSYLARDTFGYFESIEVTPDYPGSSIRVGDRFLMDRHQGLSEWQPQDSRFEGSVYVLIDGFSFSTCADVATVLHHHKWATFIGEETGGGYDGNTSGHTRTVVLPNSGIKVNIPMWKYTTANLGHNLKGRGVPPDHHVVPKIEDLLEENDVAMAQAVNLIKGSAR